MVDTCAAEFEAETPYYYSTYDEESERRKPASTGKKKVLVLGSGPIRIGQGIEFDYCSVHAVWALQELGCETVIINNNPETVSTDFDTADTPVLRAAHARGRDRRGRGREAWTLPSCSSAGRPPSIWPKRISKSWASRSSAHPHGRHRRSRGPREVRRDPGEVRHPASGGSYGHAPTEEAVKAADELGYPVLVRPSYVLGGQGMEIAYKEEDVREFMQVISRSEGRESGAGR